MTTATWTPVKTVTQEIVAVIDMDMSAESGPRPTILFDADLDYSPDLYEVEFFAQAAWIPDGGYDFYIPRNKRRLR